MPYEYFKFKSAFQFQCPGIPIFSPQMDLSSLRRNCSSVNSFNICSSCNYSKNTQTHPKKKHPKIPTVTADRLASPHRSKTRNKYPAVEDLVGWLRPRIEAGFGPSTLLLDYLPGQERPAFVDHRLLSLVPEARYLDREDPIPEFGG